ncbi:sulfite exporter TauE/SafE family protein [Sulfuricurvum sp.]|uniref:sulfite exporter TauE/SafE family protein n=1 Tax=Sulfuricurvum sp. TaxID=2025608 RepID=UPI0026022096|nr:sulfite exporter TauE/SafE family protein [Sulfuricurvum sp.]MDD4948793.1 sulfite exporter TauE/SafE family protein [Sulfuricurvum sp.]
MIKPFFYGALIGILGGLMGLGGAEFRLPILTFIFDFATLHAVVINLIISWVTVISSLIFRWESWAAIEPYWTIVLTLLSGSLIGASFGASLASRIDEKRLDRIVALLLGIIALVMITESLIHFDPLRINFIAMSFLGFSAGVIIGLFSSMLGVAGGELIIPTIALLYGVDIKIAGTLSLMVSLPTIMVGLYRYRNKEPFAMVKPNIPLIGWMAAGSILGAWVGKSMLGHFSSGHLHIFLAVILSLSAIKLYKKGMQ